MVQEEKNDWEWVQRVQNGETEAFEALVIRYGHRIFNLLYRWLGNYDEASEVAQEVFLSAFRAIKQFRGDSSFSTWIYRISINQAKNRKKKLKPDWQRIALAHGGPEEGGLEISSSELDPSQAYEQKEVQKRVQEGINHLSQEEALLILLHDFQEVPYEGMAEILDLPLGTVKSRLHRARQSLKKWLTPYFSSGRNKT
ncbi:MAG TPA: sigma-70 family RNA polymerase sigma factor [Nitrospiria bacterium]|jgi:RNA polymerase sigma-70 factor (ECF subfamily)